MHTLRIRHTKRVVAFPSAAVAASAMPVTSQMCGQQLGGNGDARVVRAYTVLQVDTGNRLPLIHNHASLLRTTSLYLSAVRRCVHLCRRENTENHLGGQLASARARACSLLYVCLFFSSSLSSLFFASSFGFVENTTLFNLHCSLALPRCGIHQKLHTTVL